MHPKFWLLVSLEKMGRPASAELASHRATHWFVAAALSAIHASLFTTASVTWHSSCFTCFQCLHLSSGRPIYELGKSHTCAVSFALDHTSQCCWLLGEDYCFKRYKLIRKLGCIKKKQFIFYIKNKNVFTDVENWRYYFNSLEML